MTPALRAGEQRIETGCCIVGGGPAGLTLGYLLARAGVEVVVVEKHADFHRDFRGDTVHPSTLQVLDELGLLDDFLRLPHAELREFHGMVGRRLMRAADFRHVPGREVYRNHAAVGLLNFLVGTRCAGFRGFGSRMNAEATDLVRSGTRVTRRSGEDAARFRWQSTPSWSSARTAGIRCCAVARGCRRSNSALRSTSFGCASRALQTIRPSCSRTLPPDASWSAINCGYLLPVWLHHPQR